MNFPDTFELEEIIKHGGPKTERERILLEALQEETRIKDTLTGIFDDYPSIQDLCPDLERIRKTLLEVCEYAERITREYYDISENNTEPKENTPEWLAYKIGGLFDDGIMDFDEVEALLTVQNCYEIAEKAWKEI